MTRLPFVTAAAAALLAAASPASAVTVVADLGDYTVSYEDSTVFGGLSFWGGGGGGSALFGWNVPTSVQVVSNGAGIQTFSTALPDFTITAKSGFTLGGISGFMGNLSYSEVGSDASTAVSAVGNVALNGFPVGALTITLTRVPSINIPGVYVTGFMNGTSSSSPFGLQSFTLSGAMLTLTADAGAGSIASVTGMNQNKLEIDLTVTPVPEPETYALMAAGLATFGVLALRRRRQR